MAIPLVLLKFATKVALNAVSGGVGGDFAVEVLPDIARDIWTWWAKDRTEAQRKADVQALVQMPTAEVQRQVKEVVREVAAAVPLDQQLQLETFLNEMPAVARQSLMRRDDPRGSTIPSHMPLQKSDDLLPFLPRRLPRFKPGDRPLHHVDWELVKLLGVGGFGEVWKARNPHAPNLQAALKFCLDPAARDQLLKYEAGVLARVMSQGGHPGIVRLRQTYLSADPPCLEYEFIEGGDLAGAIRHATDTRDHSFHRQGRLYFAIAHRPLDCGPVEKAERYRAGGCLLSCSVDLSADGRMADLRSRRWAGRQRDRHAHGCPRTVFPEQTRTTA